MKTWIIVTISVTAAAGALAFFYYRDKKKKDTAQSGSSGAPGSKSDQTTNGKDEFNEDFFTSDWEDDIGGGSSSGSTSGSSSQRVKLADQPDPAVKSYILSDLGSGYAAFDVRFINRMNQIIHGYCRKKYNADRQKQLDCGLYQMIQESKDKKNKGQGDWFDERMTKYSFNEIKNAFFKPKWTDHIVTWAYGYRMK